MISKPQLEQSEFWGFSPADFLRDLNLLIGCSKVTHQSEFAEERKEMDPGEESG